MKTLPMQVVIIELENGQRGVFVGRPLVSDECPDLECQVENVWFTGIQQVPDFYSVDDLSDMALQQLNVNALRKQ